MTKPLTIRINEETVKQLDELANRQHRSRNYLANQALKTYLRQVEGTIKSAGAAVNQNVPVAMRLEDLRADVWPDEDKDEFLEFLKAERKQNLLDDVERGSY